ncbi:MAG: ABC transporter permease [Burkholderiales bacterium]|nr:ABC transporter permease [Anaerolineae bacterium]
MADSGSQRYSPISLSTSESIGVRLPRLLADYSTVLVVVVMFVFFSLSSENFFTGQNLFNVLKQMSIVAIIGIGMTMVILIGGIDLSVGSVVLMSGGVAAVLIQEYNFGPWLAIAVGVGAGALVGLVNGLLIEVAHLSPVIATLGTLIGVRGLGQIIIDNTYVWVTDGVFVGLAANKVLFLPMMATVMILLYVVVAIVLKQTIFGRYVYAIGGNPIASRLVALPVVRTKVLVYVLCGAFAGVAGMLTAATIGFAGPNNGANMEFSAIAAVVLGGTRLGGGVGRVERTFLGTAILTMTLNYLTIRGIPDIWQQTVTGFLLLAAVLLNYLAQRKR